MSVRNFVSSFVRWIVGSSACRFDVSRSVYKSVRSSVCYSSSLVPLLTRLIFVHFSLTAAWYYLCSGNLRLVEEK